MFSVEASTVPLFVEKNKGVHVIIDSDALVDLLKEDLLLRCAAV
mgnify:CR=1 FL=1